MNNVTEIVAMEIQKTFDFYRATTEDNETVVQKILISGGGSKLHGPCPGTFAHDSNCRSKF